MTLAGAHVRTLGLSNLKGSGSMLHFGVDARADIIAVGSLGKVLLFDIASGEHIISCSRQSGHLYDYFSLRISPDGGHILILESEYCYGWQGLSLGTLTDEFVRSICPGILCEPDCDTELALGDVAFAPNSDILVADTGNSRVQVFSPDGLALLRSISRWGVTVYEPEEEEDDMIEDDPDSDVYGTTGFWSPAALAVHAGQLYVLDQKIGRVQVFN